MNAPIDISTVTIQTQRLVLRPWTQSDLEDFYEYARVDGVGQMAGWLPHASVEVSQAILNSFIEHNNVFAIAHNGKVIGSLGIEKYNEERYPELASLQGREIGYVLSKKYWGNGLMPEAVRAVIDYLFTEIGLDFVMCAHFVWNKQSARVIEKCGFQYLSACEHTTRYETVETIREYILYNTGKKA